MIKCCLKQLLKEHGLSQKELCIMIKSRPSTICDLCNNNSDNIKISLIENICNVLHCEISDIFVIK